MGLITIPGSKRLLFICLRSHPLIYSDKAVARYQLHSGGENSPVVAHLAGMGAEVLGAWCARQFWWPTEERQGSGHSLCCHITGIYPTGLWRLPPS